MKCRYCGNTIEWVPCSGCGASAPVLEPEQNFGSRQMSFSRASTLVASTVPTEFTAAMTGRATMEGDIVAITKGEIIQRAVEQRKKKKRSINEAVPDGVVFFVFFLWAAAGIIMLLIRYLVGT